MRKSGYIIIEGNIGAGKSTFAKILVEEMQKFGVNANYLPEPDETNNPFLPLYYGDPKKYAYTMQMHLLSKRYAATQYAQWGALSGQGWFIMDRSYFGDLCFANVQMKEGMFTDDEFASYISAHKSMQTNIHFPTAAIFLDVLPTVCKCRIDKRMSEKEGRKCESDISLEYLSDLGYEITRLRYFMEERCPVEQLLYDDDLSLDEIREIAHNLADRILNSCDKRTDFYSPWGACSNALFDVERNND